MIERVNPSHPDKIADRIAGAIVDLAYTKQDEARKPEDRRRGFNWPWTMPPNN